MVTDSVVTARVVTARVHVVLSGSLRPQLTRLGHNNVVIRVTSDTVPHFESQFFYTKRILLGPGLETRTNMTFCVENGVANV